MQRSGAFCRQWAQNIEAFQHTARKHLMTSTANELKQYTDNLESAMPRWDTICDQPKLDLTLIKERILEHPRRSQVKPLVNFVRALLVQSTSWESEWGKKYLEDRTRTFVSSTLQAGCHYICITAACNTIVNFQHADKSAQMAENVLSIADKQDGAFKLPLAMRTLLEQVAEGMPPKMPGAELEAEASAVRPPGSAGAAASSSGAPAVAPALEAEPSAAKRPTLAKAELRQGPQSKAGNARSAPVAEPVAPPESEPSAKRRRKQKEPEAQAPAKARRRPKTT